MPARTPLTLCVCVSRGCGKFINKKTGEKGVYLDNRSYRRHQEAECTPPRLCTCVKNGCAMYVDKRTGEKGVYLDIRSYRKHQEAERKFQHAERKFQQAESNRDLERLALRTQRAVLENHDEALARAIAQMEIRENRQTKEVPARHEEIVRYHNQAKLTVAKDLGKMLDHCDYHRGEILKRNINNFISAGVATVRQVNDALGVANNVIKFVIDTRQTLARSRRGPARNTPAIRSLRKSVEQKLDELIELAREADSSCEIFLQKQDLTLQDNQGAKYNSDHRFKPILENTSSLIRLVLFMIVAGHIILGFSQRATYWLFSMSKFIMQATVQRIYGDGGIPAYFEQILENFPLDIRAATKKFELEGKAEIYAVCPSCHTNYKPCKINEINTYRERCNARRYGHRCREILTRPKVVQNTTIFVPIIPYLVFDFDDWMADMLSRKGYENKMDEAWTRMHRAENGSMNDIFQGSRIRNFRGFDNKHFSEAGPPNAAHYLFSLGFDFFNPRRNLANGKKVSVGVIALVCLNLPIDLRYKPENMFLAGIIPGPKEPDYDHINPYFKPIVDFFLRFWTGVRFSKTSCYEMGRWILCALIALICDLPAARKAGGFVAASHERYCSICSCNKALTPYDDYQYKKWKHRSEEGCRADAQQFYDAASQKKADGSVDSTGVRYTEFLRLPYYHPTMSPVVDPMHNLYLGLVKEHFQNILGHGKSKKDLQGVEKHFAAVDINIVSTDPKNPPPEKKEELSGVKRLVTCLQQPLKPASTQDATLADLVKELMKGNRTQVAAFVYVGNGLHCFPSSNNGKRLKKADMALFLARWRIAQVEIPISALSMRLGNLISEDHMTEIREDIKRMIKPTWMASIPTSISSVGPKLKSDEWRVAASLYLPVSLIRLWSLSDDEDLRSVLHLTMLLFSAICIISSRVTSVNQADMYTQNMVQYRQELKRLFPNYKCHPNHHMAFHIRDFIIQYGPVHGWWTFPFERMIGVLQRISTNYQEGEYETTIATTWSKRSNLTAIFSKAACPTAIQHCKDIFMKLVQPDIRDAASIYDNEEDNDAIKDSVKVTPLAPEVVNAFRHRLERSFHLPSRAIHLKRYRTRGVSYTVYTTHEGNSGIIRNDSEVPYRIEGILSFTPDNKVESETIWFVVRAHVKSKVREDPYIKYPHLRARMWGVGHENSIQVIPISSISGHFAKCIVPWGGQDVAVCVSLSRTQPT